MKTTKQFTELRDNNAFGINPRGTWVTDNLDHIVVGATTRSPDAFFLIPFIATWTGLLISMIYCPQISKGVFNAKDSLIGLFFLLFSLIFWWRGLMMIFGKVEIVIGEESSVFVGIGKVGRRKHFNFSGVKKIRMAKRDDPRTRSFEIIFEGDDNLSFGSLLNEDRCVFVFKTLQEVKSSK